MVQRILGKAKRESYFLSSSLYHVTRRHAMERYFSHENGALRRAAMLNLFEKSGTLLASEMARPV